MPTLFTETLSFHGNDGDLGEAVIEKVVVGADLPALGIRLRQDVVVRTGTIFAALGSKLMRPDVGCAPSANNGNLKLRERWLDPIGVEIEDKYCAADFDKIVKGLSLKVGIEKKDLTGTDVEPLLKELYANVWMHDFKSLALSGDRTLGTATETLKFYATQDGLFKQLMVGAALYTADPTDPDGIRRFATATGTLAANAMRDTILPGMYALQTLTMKAMADTDKVFVVSNAMYENYYSSIVGVAGFESTWRLLQDGTSKLYYRGIEVIGEVLIDEAVTDLTIVTKNRGWLTVKDNLEVAVDTATESAVMELFYDKVTKFNYIRINHTLATQYADARLTVVAY